MRIKNKENKKLQTNTETICSIIYSCRLGLYATGLISLLAKSWYKRRQIPRSCCPCLTAMHACRHKNTVSVLNLGTEIVAFVSYIRSDVVCAQECLRPVPISYCAQYRLIESNSVNNCWYSHLQRNWLYDSRLAAYQHKKGHVPAWANILIGKETEAEIALFLMDEVEHRAHDVI